MTPVWPPRAGHRSSGEDLAAFFDALVRGYRVVFEPSAIVFHEHRRTYARQLYWHGLGLSAHLFRSLLARPAQIPGFLRWVPRGFVYGFGTSSIRNDKKSAAYPATLTRAEWRGVAHGPFAYLSVLRYAAFKDDFGPRSQLYSTSVSNSTSLAVLASAAQTMLINMTANSLTAALNGVKEVLAPYQVSVVSTPV